MLSIVTAAVFLLGVSNAVCISYNDSVFYGKSDEIFQWWFFFFERSLNTLLYNFLTGLFLNEKYCWKVRLRVSFLLLARLVS